MKKYLEAELSGGSIEHDWSYLRPIKYIPLWRRMLELVAFALILSALVYGLLWLASTGVL